MKKLTLYFIGLFTTLSLNATDLKRTGWNLISVCEEMNATAVDMTNIEELQSQDGETGYTGEFAFYSNLTQLEAGYAYWVKGEANTTFDSGFANGALVKPLKRTGWNLMASCEEIRKDDINMTNIEEIQAQDGKSIYIGDDAKYSNLDGLINGYGYWVKGDKGTLFTAKRKVIEEDTIKPIITLIGDSTVRLIQGTAYTDEGAIASDNRDGNITSNIVILNPVNISVVGIYTITYDVADSSGNVAVQVIRTINIGINQTPIFFGVNDINITLDSLFNLRDNISVSDVEDGNITNDMNISGIVNTRRLGNYTVTYSITDSFGNTKDVNRTVSVQNPVDCKNDFSSSGVTGKYFGLTSEWKASYYSHKCSEINASSPIVIPSELNTSNPRIEYAHIFKRERELYNYNPRFLPGRVYFDKNNLPWIYINNMNQLDLTDPTNPKHKSAIDDVLTGKKIHEVTYDERAYSHRYSEANPCASCDSYVLHLTAEGKWIAFSIVDLAQSFGFRKNTRGIGSSGQRYGYIEQIYFQDNGDVYVKTDHGLLRYIVATQKWAGYKMNFIGEGGYLFGNGDRAPMVLKDRGLNESKMYLYRLINLTDDGGGSITTQTINHGKKLGLYKQSQAVALVGNTIHVASISFDETDSRESPVRADWNTANYYLRYNIDTEEQDLMFMGWTGSGSMTAIDAHNQPALLKDSKNYIHYISGAHGHLIWHRKSLLPADDGTWSNNNTKWDINNSDTKFSLGQSANLPRFSKDTPTLTGVDYVGKTNGIYTYIHTRIDSNDIIHILLRENIVDGSLLTKHYRGAHLTYIRGIPKGNGDYIWQDKGKIIKSNWWQYSNYRQKIHQDNSDNIYVSYTYEIQTFNDTGWYNQAQRNPKDDEGTCLNTAQKESDCLGVKAEHDRLWSDEPAVGTATRREQNFQHNQSMLSTNDMGETWTVTTTADFYERANISAPLVGLSVTEITGTESVKLYGFAKGGSDIYAYSWKIDGVVKGSSKSLEVSGLLSGEHSVELIVNGMLVHRHKFRL
jgi:hypothetical protein